MHSKGMAIYCFNVAFQNEEQYIVSDIRVGVATYGQMAFLLTGLQKRLATFLSNRFRKKKSSRNGSI